MTRGNFSTRFVQSPTENILPAYDITKRLTLNILTSVPNKDMLEQKSQQSRKTPCESRDTGSVSAAKKLPAVSPTGASNQRKQALPGALNASTSPAIQGNRLPIQRFYLQSEDKKSYSWVDNSEWDKTLYEKVPFMENFWLAIRNLYRKKKQTRHEEVTKTPAESTPKSKKQEVKLKGKPEGIAPSSLHESPVKSSVPHIDQSGLQQSNSTVTTLPTASSITTAPKISKKELRREIETIRNVKWDMKSLRRRLEGVNYEDADLVSLVEEHNKVETVDDSKEENY